MSKSSFLSVADPVQALRQIRERGGRVVFVDPREVEPGIGETLQLRPDSDPYLLAAMLHEIHRSVGFELGAFEGRVDGLDELIAFVATYSPAAVAEIVGLSEATIADLAREFAAADGASIHASTGLNMGRQGALAYWLVQMLLLLTGNLDRPGGNYFAARAFPMSPAPIDRTAGSFEAGPWGPFRRSVGMLPSAVLPEHIDDTDEPLRLFVLAGNPVLTVGGGDQLAESLRSLELLVSIDLYRNATGELADFVLPATDQFEREDLNVFVQGVQGEPFVQWTPRVVEPRGEARQEWQIYGQLLQAMGRTPMLDPGIEDPVPMLFDGALAAGGASIGALRDAGGVMQLPEAGPGGSLGRLGIDGTIDTVPDGLRSTLARGHALFEELGAEAPDQFKLVTRKTRTTINSWLQNLPSHSDGDDDEPNPLWMNPDDGRRLGVAAGDRVAVSNGYGAIEAGVRFDPRLRTGVVGMTHGFGNAATSGMPGAQARPGVNVNALAPHGPGTFDPVSCMSHVTGIAVDVRPTGESGT